MPLAAHARWKGGTLVLAAALGHGNWPLLRAEVEGVPADAEAAAALGDAAAAKLRDAGAAAYLAAI